MNARVAILGALATGGALRNHSPLGYAKLDPRMAKLARERYRLAHEVRGVGPARQGVFDPQDAFFLPVFGFKGIHRPGPDVLIYRRND